MPELELLTTRALPPGTVAGDRGVYGVAERPHPQVPPVIFVGGTGRSGTHIVARFLGRNTKITSIPVECRFHTDPEGFPGLLGGTVTKERFVRHLRGFWWKGRQRGRKRGMFRFVEPETFEHAVREFEERFDSEPEAACRALFFALLWPRAVKKGASCIVEQSCDTIAEAPLLTRLFPEAKFVHVVRDGRDASASRVAQTKGIIYPRTRRQGLAWWEDRIGRIDRGRRAIPPDRFLEIGLEDLLTPPRRKVGSQLAKFAGVRLGQRMRRFFWGQMDAEAANTERWRRGLSRRRQERIETLYLEALERLDRSGASCVAILRSTDAACRKAAS